MLFFIPLITLHFGRREDLGDGTPNEFWALSSVDRGPDSSLLVVLDDRGSLVVVGSKTFLKSSSVVVRSLDEGLASLVIGHGLLWWVDCDSAYACTSSPWRHSEVTTHILGGSFVQRQGGSDDR